MAADDPKHPSKNNTLKHTRRTFLRTGIGLGAATAAGVLLQAGRAHAQGAVAHDPHPADLPEDPHGFPLGVTAGDVTDATVALWTRYDRDAPLRLVVWQTRAGALAKDWRQVVHHDAPVGVRGAMLIPVDGLEPFTEYRYAFYEVEDGRPARRSRVGRFKTTPARDALIPITLGATCCTMNGMDQKVLAAAGRRKDIDTLLQLGDAVYADGSESLDDYRKRWWDNLSKPGYQAMRASTSLLATWDDHEVDNDWDPETIAPEKLAAARGAFFEHMPMCRDDGCPERIWRSQRWGKTVEVFVLDSRSERRRSMSPKQYISPEQMEWLKSGLEKSECVFKVIVSSVPISRFPPIFSGSKQDRWETFPEQRTELLSFIEGKDIPAVLFLSGDFHLAMLSRASPRGPGSRTLEVLAGPGAQVGHVLVPWLFGKQFDWASARNNITTLRFDPSGRLDIGYHGDNETFHTAAYRRKASTGFDKVDSWLL